MKDKIKVVGILLLTGFSFFYTNKVSDIIKENDPIMKEIRQEKEVMKVNKVDRVIMGDEYITGINGCVIDEKNSYNKMKNEGQYKEDLIVMKEDEIKKDNNLYIVGGNKEKRNVSIVLLKNNEKMNNYFKKNNIFINYFLDGNYIIDNIDSLIKISKNANIYSLGRNNTYNSKYIIYDNNVIKTNFNNESNYCLLKDKNDDLLKLCSSYNMKTIKGDFISDNYLSYTKENLYGGKIFIYDNITYNDLIISINYILSKGYNIISLDELLDETNKCN